ncbi:hypothetical protein C0993_009514 [Termitomyces sp. T159_Od127]|nr:hypothetical protein C0993_009514 [Termitomyces sp. T159_Od127]
MRLEKESKRFHDWQKLKSKNDRKKSQKRYKSTYGRPSEASSTISAAKDSDSDNEPSISKRKLDTTDISDNACCMIPPQKKIKPSIPASTVQTEDESNVVSSSDFSLEDLQLTGQQSNVATTDQEEPLSFSSSSEPESPQVAPESTPLLHGPLPPATLNKPPVTISQGLDPLDSQVQDVLNDTTSANVSKEPRISTKQRLSFGALALRPPKVISSTVSGSRNQVPPLKATYTSFMPLGFKKGIVQASFSGGHPGLPEPTLSSINALPSPSTQDDLDIESSHTPKMQDHNTNGEVNDEFLEDLMFRSFTNVLKSAEECAVESLRPQSPILERLPTSELPQKLWTWSGDVYNSTDPSKPMFGITINGVAPIMVEGLNLSDAIICMEHLFLTCFYDAVDFDSIFSVCKEIRQFATLHPRSSADIEDFDLFCTYMAKRHKLYTYGSHETIPRKLWGIREIYPCGGIVTFTPQALLDDISGVIHRIGQIQRHPLWECYIMPSVLGMAVTLYSQREGSDPISDFDRGRLPYIPLLSAIEDGELALISSPPNYNSSSTKDVDEWVEKFWTYRPGDSRATIQACVDAFSRRYPELLLTHLTSAILDEISKDLRCMRTQPVFMENYRRYVVLDSPRAWRETREDALEWTSTAKFDFKDEFFQKQECV